MTPNGTQDSEDAIAAARRVYAANSLTHNQARTANSQSNTGHSTSRTSGLVHLSENSKYWTGNTGDASQSTTASVVGIDRADRQESSTHSSALPLHLPLDERSKAPDPFSDDAEVVVVESESENDSADELISPDSSTPVFHPSDQIFIVMGVTGAGKSTFISLLTEANVEVGHELQSSETS